MQGDSKKRRSAITSAIVIIAVAAIALALCLWVAIMAHFWVVSGLIGIYAFLLASVIMGVLISLRQRLREINNGEAKEAEKY